MHLTDRRQFGILLSIPGRGRSDDDEFVSLLGDAAHVGLILGPRETA
jgi:hypothetical protein